MKTFKEFLTEEKNLDIKTVSRILNKPIKKDPMTIGGIALLHVIYETKHLALRINDKEEAKSYIDRNIIEVYHKRKGTSYVGDDRIKAAKETLSYFISKEKDEDLRKEMIEILDKINKLG